MKKLFTAHKILSLIVAVAIMLSGIPLTAAGAVTADAGGCVHEHNEACGYIEAAPCTHECGEDCAEGFVHEHDEACGYTEGADCAHEHDADCGGLPQDNDPTATPGITEPPADDVTVDNIPLGYSVVAFAELADEVASQTVTVGTEDAKPEALTLPDSLDATVSDGESENQTAIEGVTWQSEPEYAAITVGELEIVPVGTHVFTPALPEDYALADGVPRHT